MVQDQGPCPQHSHLARDGVQVRAFRAFANAPAHPVVDEQRLVIIAFCISLRLCRAARAYGMKGVKAIYYTIVCHSAGFTILENRGSDTNDSGGGAMAATAAVAKQRSRCNGCNPTHWFADDVAYHPVAAWRRPALQLAEELDPLCRLLQAADHFPTHLCCASF
jgi:hypothetical protein